MRRRDWRIRVNDILEAIQRIQQYVGGMEFQAFCRDNRTVDAVIRNPTVIGEAAAAMPADLVSMRPDIPWQLMRRMRNVLVHEYFGVSLPILWQTVQEDVPPLRPLLLDLLASSDDLNLG